MISRNEIQRIIRIERREARRWSIYALAPNRWVVRERYEPGRREEFCTERDAKLWLEDWVISTVLENL